MARFFHALLAGLNNIASFWVMFLVALISTDVIGRAAFNAPLPGVPEIVKFSIVGMVWLWMAYTLRSGAHLRTNLVLGRLPRAGQKVVLIVNSLVGIGLFAMITWLSWIEMMKSWDIGAFEGEYPVRVPVAPLWAILVLGATLTAIQFALDVVRYATKGPRPSEIADVPDIAEKAL